MRYMKKCLYFVLSVLFFVLASDYSASAALFKIGNKVYIGLQPDSCEMVDEILFGNKSKYLQQHVYEKYKRLLFLADGSKESIADEVRAWAPEDAMIIKSDLQLPHEQRAKNFITHPLDHNMAFDLKSNSADAIVMKRGVCHCTGSQTNCSGVSLVNDDFMLFIGQVVRVLDSNSPTAFSYLHGGFLGINPVVENFVIHRHEEQLERLRKSLPGHRFEEIYMLREDMKKEISEMAAEIETLVSQPFNPEAPKKITELTSKISAIEKDTDSYYYRGIFIQNKTAPEGFFGKYTFVK